MADKSLSLFTTVACGPELTVSISFLFSMSGRLSLISLDVIHVLIWSRNRYREEREGRVTHLTAFLARANCVGLPGASLFPSSSLPRTSPSGWRWRRCVPGGERDAGEITGGSVAYRTVAAAGGQTFCQMSSNCSTPSVTLFRHRSISPEGKRDSTPSVSAAYLPVEGVRDLEVCHSAQRGGWAG